jgi:hypothetical protein
MEGTVMDKDRLDALSLDVFRTFARCEYALKAAGFWLGRNEVKADWRAFARDLGDEFDHPVDPELAAALDYLLGQPPRKQVIRDDQLAWDDTPPDSETRADLVLAYVRRVRNNLFHGGKFNGHWFAPERSGDLLTHSLCILRHAIEAHDRVREAYRND